jgi:hypothetical protein
MVTLRVCSFPECESPRDYKRSGGDGRVRWLPDGSGLAFLDSTRRNIVVQRLDGRPQIALTKFTDQAISDFAWSPDGAQLAILRESVKSNVILFKGVKP